MLTVALQCILDLKFCVPHPGTLPLIFKGPEQRFDANNYQIVSQGNPAEESLCVGEAWLGWQVRHDISIAPSNLLLL